MGLGKIKISEDTYLVGIGVSPGISIGEIRLINLRPRIDQALIEPEEVDLEIARFRQAVDDARTQLRKIKQTVSKQPHLREHLYILDTHLLILDDDMLLKGAEQAIQEQMSAESALSEVLERLRSLFDSIEDEYLRERRSRCRCGW